MVETKTQIELIKSLINDVERGRPIVPLIGAGFSVESGMPALSGLTEYLAKVQCYILQSIFSPGTVLQDRRVGSSYDQDPSLFIGDFGWPDPHRMNADLWAWVHFACKRHPEYRSLLLHQVQAEHLRDIGRHDPGLTVLVQERLIGRELLDLLKEIQGASPETDELIREFRELPGPVSRIRLLRELSTSEKCLESEIDKPAGPFPDLNLYGNWKTLLAYLTSSNPDYVDTLFQSLVKGRQPGTTHRFLAFLTPILNLRLFLTINFDHLLERALRLEGLQPTVYEVSRESPLPHPTLVQTELSVVKLHGGTFGLRVGEELEQPLDENSRRRLEHYLKPDTASDVALLVMGIGGRDRRIRDLVELVAKRRSSPDSISVYWMHFEPECPELIWKLAKRLEPEGGVSPICPVRTYSPSAFLQELYYRATSSYPPSIHAYSPTIIRPIDSSEAKDPDQEEKLANSKMPIHIFLNAPGDLSLEASLRLARFVSLKAGSHTPIWVDLDVMHSIADVMEEIFRQVRKYDRWLSPNLLPTGPAPDDPDEASKAVRRIYTALSRGRYVLAFNSVGSFGRPPTFHHGWEEPADRGQFFWRLFQAAHRPIDGEWKEEDRAALSRGPLRDSILAFSIDPLGQLNPEDPERLPELYTQVRELGSPIVECHGPLPTRQTDDALRVRWDFDVLLLLSSFRRRRSIVALRRLLPELVPRAVTGDQKERNARIDALLESLEKGYVRRLEGGQYWMSVHMRNRIYKIGQRYTDSKALASRIELRIPNRTKTPRNLARLASMHESIADFYYSEMFAASQDAVALLEHLYHRISALRYLTKLDAWIPQEGLGSLPEPVAASLREYLGRWYLPNAEPVRKRLRELRLHRLRSLRAVLERERERLLSDVASDTLIGWIDWIRDKDLPRFLVRTCLISVGGAPTGTLPADDDLESQIEAECENLKDLIEDLRADVLRDKMDFLPWADLRAGQLLKLLDLKSPVLEALPSLIRGDYGAEQAHQLEGDLNAIGQGAARLDLDGQRKVVLALCDLWACLRGCGELARARQVLECLDRIAARCSSGANRNPVLEQLQVAVLRSKADHGLTGLSPWASRTISDTDVAERCRDTIEACREALRIIEWGAGSDYGRHKSYFHSLKGRAHYLRKEFTEAFQEMDLSQVGTSSEIGAMREALAVGLLRLAELLMARADAVIAEERSWELAMTYAQRHLFRAEDVLTRAEEMLAGARQNVECWVCLYQLKAQVQVEHLLLQVSESPGEDPEVWHRRFIAQFLQRLKTGLRAIRQGLDVVPRIRNEEPITSRDFRLTRLLQAWMELMICGAYLTRRIDRDQHLDEDKLWQRWEFLNKAVGIHALHRSTHPFFKRLDGLYAPRRYPHGKEGRDETLAWIRGCASSGAIEELVKALGS
ncbi:MAG TPA: SIR2 family protein [Thermoanaerobaculia bacterium]|nr:SIR2 family protein [Thermoanaerobaculia bacterium]